MDTKEILKFCVEKGLLLDPEVLTLFSENVDEESVKLIIEKIRNHTQKRIITKELFEKNRKQVSEFFLELPKENQEKLERFKIKLGLQIEISKESSAIIPEDISFKSFHSKNSMDNDNLSIPFNVGNVKVMSPPIPGSKKIEVEDFVKGFRNRFYEIKSILQDHSELGNLVSINKLAKNRQSVSIIGMVVSKSVTKNRNILFEVEDFTGRIKILVNQNKQEIYKKAEEISMDAVIGFTGFGDREIFFVNNIIFPEAMLFEKKQSPMEEYALFISDLQFGSRLFLKDQFNKFIDYLSDRGPKTEEVRKIKYLFLVGDLVSGVGVYPSQIKDLEIEDIEEQFKQLTEILKRIRKDIQIIISPGNHDGVRLMEPQPGLDEKYAWPIYDLPNAVITGNPAYINIGATSGFSGFDVLTYHGFSYPYYANNIPSLIEGGLNNPEKIMAYLLKNRHLAPTHGSIQYFPTENDQHVIKKVPDIFVSGHLHKCAISSYNGILLISNSSWEEETENQKKRGNQPDFCKVPMFNLKTRAIKILDFE
jgi:DNA polymerase II small subunit